MAKHAGTARHAYNWGLDLCKQILEHNKSNPENKIKFPSAIDLHKWLVALVKPENSWYYEVSKSAPQQALKALSDAFGRFWKKLGGFPRFKKKGQKDAFTLDGAIKVIDPSGSRSPTEGDPPAAPSHHHKIQVPRIGVLKTYEQLPFGYKPKSGTISRQADKWFISFRIEVEPKPTDATGEIGVHLGLLRFATLSSGEEIESPRPYKQLAKQLAKLQWRNRNKELHSKNWKKAQVKIARLHTRIGNIRKDFLHKLTTRLAKNHGKVVIEDLNVRGLIAFGHLAKAVSDSGFYEFRRQLEYKCQLYNSELILASRWFPSSKTCYNCGLEKGKLPLSVRVFECSCGWKADRDYNASLNLLRIAHPEVTPVQTKTSVAPSLKQELKPQSDNLRFY